MTAVKPRLINPQDLLGRKPVSVNLRESLAYLRGKRVLVTGAGGSIGSELCRQLLYAGAARLYLFGHGENAIYEIERELSLLREDGVGEKTTIVPVIGDMRDGDYVNYIIDALKADAVFHAAAYKHVPLMEENAVSAIENNVFGTLNLVTAVQRRGSTRFLFITTDKAVDPVSVYGASKFLCERIVLRAKAPDSQFVVVRFANVLGSRGSIMPLFQRQIERGGPLTLTHPDMTRYFMTIPEACSLVLKAGGVGEGGALYVLDMGEPVRVRDIAWRMISLYGLVPEKDIKIVVTGVRAGERLDESLVAGGEHLVSTPFPRINRVERTSPPAFDIDRLLAALSPVCAFDPACPRDYRNASRLREILHEAIPSVPAGGDSF